MKNAQKALSPYGGAGGLRRFVATASVIVYAALLLLSAGAAQTSSPRDALWQIVNGMCVPDQTQNHDPKPCAVVEMQEGNAQGFALLKDIRGETQYLLIPTAKTPGIESPAVLAPDAANYFASAWEARSYVEGALHRTLPPDDISLAVNSLTSRSQDQLHIHVDCVRKDVYDALHSNEEPVGERWMPLAHPLLGHPYKAMWVAGEHLGANNPFKLLADGVPGAREHMGDYTLVVIGLTRPDGTKGFVLLEDQVSKEGHDMASGEELQDHACRIGRE
jgi:CDP-diacylglycerol pyrophosphatase